MHLGTGQYLVDCGQKEVALKSSISSISRGIPSDARESRPSFPFPYSPRTFTFSFFITCFKLPDRSLVAILQIPFHCEVWSRARALLGCKARLHGGSPVFGSRYVRRTFRFWSRFLEGSNSFTRIRPFYTSSNADIRPNLGRRRAECPPRQGLSILQQANNLICFSCSYLNKYARHLFCFIFFGT